VNAAPATRARSVEVVAGLDARQVEAAFALHSAWAAERGCEMDAPGWAAIMQGFCGSGRYAIWTAWDGETPVGVAEIHLVYDPMTHDNAIFAERAYVLPEYRNDGVFRAITESLIAFADGLGIKTQRMSAEVDLRGRAMQRFYGSYGFKPVSVLMGRDL